MVRLLATSALAGALLAAPAFAQTMDSAGSAPQQQQLAAQDQNFARDAAIAGKTEIELGRMAEQKGGTQAIKDFGRRMVTDHSKAGLRLAAVAKKDEISLPTDLDQPSSDLRDKLAKESGPAFDRDYVGAAVDTHQQAVALFASESKSGQNPDLKQFAAATLPMIHHHLMMAQSLQAAMTRAKPQAESRATMGSGSSAKAAGRSGDDSADQLNRQELQSLGK